MLLSFLGLPPLGIILSFSLCELWLLSENPGIILALVVLVASASGESPAPLAGGTPAMIDPLLGANRCWLALAGSTPGSRLLPEAPAAASAGEAAMGAPGPPAAVLLLVLPLGCRDEPDSDDACMAPAAALAVAAAFAAFDVFEGAGAGPSVGDTQAVSGR